MRGHHFLVCVLAATLTLAECHDHDGDGDQPPNVLLFMADDLGYGDLGCFGNTSLRTPHLDKLAGEGVKLTHSIAASSICTPSRAAFLTGRYPIRSGMASSSFIRVSFLTASKTGLPVQELTVAKVAKQAGYVTALLGKWHLGWSEDRTDPNHHHPLNQGFDYFYGIPLTSMRDFDPREIKAWRLVRPSAFYMMVSTYPVTLLCTCLVLRMARPGRVGRTVILFIMVFILLLCGCVHWVIDNLAFLNSFFYRNYQLVEQPIHLTQATRKLVQEGVQFLEQRKKDGQPFLLMVSWLQVHTAMAAGPMFRGKSSHGPYGDAVEELDWGVGQLMEALQSMGLGNNILVFFTSDNGGHVEEHDFAGRRAGGYNGVFKGGKAHGAPEGGMRVPTIMKWPGKVPAGQVIDEPVSLMDVLPTVARALRVQLPANRVLDGKDLLPLLSGREKLSPHEFLFHYCQKKVHAIRYRPREGKRIWKLVLYEPGYIPNTQRCYFLCHCFDATPLDPPPLFDLSSDPGERRPLLAGNLPEYRALVDVMLTALQQHQDSIAPVDNMFSPYKLLWRPWDQPVCRFPYFQCEDDKFIGIFVDDDDVE